MTSFGRSRTIQHSAPSSPASSESPIRPRRPSLDPQGEILSTRGQYLPSLIRRRSFSNQSDFLDSEHDGFGAFWDAIERPALARAKELIGEGRPSYNWQQYYKHASALKGLPKPVRQIYKRNNDLISQYVYIDRLLDSSLPHRLFVDYQHSNTTTPLEGPAKATNGNTHEGSYYGSFDGLPDSEQPKKIKRTPRNLYRIPSESSLHLPPAADEGASLLSDISPKGHDFVDGGARIVTIAIYINFVANVILLAAKIAALLMTNSVSVLASLVDGALDFLSTTIVWLTTALIRRQDRYEYPISRRRLEPLSVLVFAVVMVTSFFQVAITSASRLISSDRAVVDLTVPSAIIMGSTVVIKFLCWFWCRMIKNSSVQALAQDAMTDVVFNSFSIVFPLVGGLTNTWFVDPLGGLLLSIYIIWNWGSTASEHIRHLTGAAASPTDVSILLYMAMRFSKAILKIQNIRAYYAGDLLNVELDIVLEDKTSLRDSHDLGESLQYMLESVPTVERAFVHMDYDPWNIPTHLNQQES